MMDMKHIRLKRIDESAEEVNISLGEAVIGRGELLGCTDKKISRNHGLLKLSEGSIIITANHQNPIFYTGKDKSPVAFNSGQSMTLHDGDEFALLPDSYQFHVTILPDSKTECEQNGCIENNVASGKVQVKEEQASEEMPEMKTECEQNGSADNKVPDNVHIKEEEAPKQLEVEQEPEKDDSMDMSSSSNRVRVLPSWMTGSTSDTSKAGPSKGTPRGRKRNDTAKNDKAVVKKKAKVNRKKGKNNADESSDGEASDNPQSNDNKRKNVDSNQLKNNTNESRGKTHELSDEEEEEEENATSATNQDDVRTGQDTTDDAQQSNDDNAAAQPAMAGNNTRQKCLYGAKCYRKNPQHRVDFSHPGDVDYDDNDLPECPYGVACYRKNKQHRLDYKHTAAPQQANQAQTKRKRNTRKTDDYEDDDEEDDYDFDDPFLNDASSDDYQPTDSDSEHSAVSEGDDEDDTKRMIKEAKRFTRKRK